MTHLDPKALEAAGVWFGRNFNGLPNSAALVNGLISAYLAALPQAEPVEFHVTDRKNGIDYTERRASPTPAVSREDVIEQLQEAVDLLAERRYGSPARSPGHNARLVVEQVISALSSEPHHG